MALYIGTNYHPHDWPEERWNVDIALMKDAGFTTVRLGHLCWDSYEPEEGVYTFEWFDQVMDLFADAGIGVVLDISMRPAPVWVHKLCPGCNIHGKSGNSQASLRRYLEDIDDPAYQLYALRFAEILVNRYKNHPALFAFGLCNEIGAGMMSYSEYARSRFANWLKKKYRTIDALNEAWAARRWSRKLTSFDDAVLQENEIAVGAPEAWLDMRRFFSDGIGHFITQLKEVVSAHAPGIPHSSNHYSGRDTLGFDYLKVCDQFVDYPGVGFYPGYELDEKFHYCKIINQERLAETGKPMWCLEFQTGGEGVFCAPPGFIRMHALLYLIDRAQMVLGWTWRSMLGGEEQYYHGMLGHDGIPTPNYTAFKQIAADMKKLQEYGFPYLPMPEIAVAFSQESGWVSQYYKKHFRQSYTDAVIQVHQVFYESNQDYNMVNLRDFKNDYKLLIIPGHIIIEPAVADTIRNYVKRGGTVIMTGYSGLEDETGKVFSTPMPGGVDDVFGIRVAGFYLTDMKGFYSENAETVNTRGRNHELLTVESAGESFHIDVDYYEHLELRTAESFAVFRDKDMCAVSKNHYGAGTAYYVAAITDKSMMAWLIKHVAGELGITEGMEVPDGIQARRITENQHYYVNTTTQDISIPLEMSGKGVLSGKIYEKELRLKAYDAELIVWEE